jgi:hypothetical protein
LSWLGGALLMAALYLVQGCSVRVPEGKYRCDEASACPDDFQCRSGFCFRKASASEEAAIAEHVERDSGMAVVDAGVAAVDAAVSSDAGPMPADASVRPDAGPSVPPCVLGQAALGACVL